MEGSEHFGKALFEDRQQELKAALEVYVDGSFGAGNGFSDGSGSGGTETALLQQGFCGCDDPGLTVSRG